MADAFDVEVVTTRAVVEGSEPVTDIQHGPDGQWICEGDTELAEANAVAVSMVQLLGADASLQEVASLPVGWGAMRFDDLPWSLTPPEDFAASSVPPVGFVVRFERDSDHNHDACGAHGIGGALCPNCDKPMLRMLSLDAADERLHLAPLGVPFVHLLFCCTCNLAQSRTAYRLLESGGVELLSYRVGGVESDFPYEGYPEFFSGAPVRLEPVPPAEVQIVAALNDGSRSASELPADERRLSVPRHQVGGAPLFLQGSPAVLCPECSMPMAFLACCADETPDGRGYTGNEFVQVVFMVCVQDRVVLSYQECD